MSESDESPDGMGGISNRSCTESKTVRTTKPHSSRVKIIAVYRSKTYFIGYKVMNSLSVVAIFYSNNYMTSDMLLDAAKKFCDLQYGEGNYEVSQ
jgi:hypothetical protein